MSPSVSVVIPSHNEGQQLLDTVECLLPGLPAAGEIVVVDDTSSDGSSQALEGRGHARVRVVRPPERLGAAGARNYGATCAEGEVLVFSDAHVRIDRDWASRLLPRLEQPGVGAVAPAVSVMHATTPAVGYGFRWKDAALSVDWLGSQGTDAYAVPLLPGCFLGVRHDLFAQIGGFDNGLVVWGSEDGELCLRLWLMGYECWIEPTLEVAHLFRAAHPYAVEWELVLHNLLRVGVVHFGRARLASMIACFSANPAFAAAFARLLDGDAWARRAWLRSRRLHDDDWFFHRFDMAW